MCQIVKCIASRIKFVFSKINGDVPRSPALKLISYKENANPSYIKFLVQIIGKNVFPSLSGQDFIDDETLLLNFLQEDQQAIDNLLRSGETTNKPYILARTYDPSNQCTFTIEYIDKNNRKRHFLINDFSKLLNHLDLFSREDIFVIGFEVGRAGSK